MAGDRDIRIVGGADVIQQYLRAGIVGEGRGRRPFEAIRRELGVGLVETIASPRVIHVRNAVRRR